LLKIAIDRAGLAFAGPVTTPAMAELMINIAMMIRRVNNLAEL
jgi:hypothetical protein